jgi:hypothetical protein
VNPKNKTVAYQTALETLKGAEDERGQPRDRFSPLESVVVLSESFSVRAYKRFRTALPLRNPLSRCSVRPRVALQSCKFELQKVGAFFVETCD